MSIKNSRIVYVLRSVNSPERYYTGLTDDVPRRLEVHNSGGSIYTRELRPGELVAFTEFTNPESAVEFKAALRLVTHS